MRIINSWVVGLLILGAFPGTQPRSAAMAADRSDSGLSVHEHETGLEILLNGHSLTEFVYRDPQILRPYFTRLRTPTGIPVTRNHPPVAGSDATDHDTMHPGVWLAFGDINGADFWRNKGQIVHREFTKKPAISEGALTFETRSDLLSPAGETLGQMISALEIRVVRNGWRLLWKASLHAASELQLGDQEEMGFGVRLATPLIEKKGGSIVNAAGQKSAKETWGQAAAWCDYSGQVDGVPAGITVVASPDNFRPSWWHNRDYGLMVANPFGRKAMKHGDASVITVTRDKPLTLGFAAIVHQGSDYASDSAAREAFAPPAR